MPAGPIGNELSGFYHCTTTHSTHTHNNKHTCTNTKHFATLSMISPLILVGDGLGASKVVSEMGVGAIVAVDGSGSAIMNIKVR